VTFRFFGFTSVFALINNSSRNNTRGTVNGIGQSLASVSRFVSPPVGGIMFAWSVSDNAPSFINFHLVFWFLFFWFAGAVILSRKLPESVNLKMVESVVEEEGSEADSDQPLIEVEEDSTSPQERTTLMRRRSIPGAPEKSTQN
jgi:hypothetical protein